MVATRYANTDGTRYPHALLGHTKGRARHIAEGADNNAATSRRRPAGGAHSVCRGATTRGIQDTGARNVVHAGLPTDDTMGRRASSGNRQTPRRIAPVVRTSGCNYSATCICSSCNSC